MDNRKHNYTDPWDDGVYGNGRTQPPKNNGGLVALLMIVVIILAGIASALGILNIRLFQALTAQSERNPMTMALDEEIDILQDSLELYRSTEESAAQKADQGEPRLGVEGEEVSAFFQRYYQLPQGLLLTRIGEGSAAYRAGLRPGDILISVDGAPIGTMDALNSALAERNPGDLVTLVIYREGNQYSTSVTLG